MISVTQIHFKWIYSYGIFDPLGHGSYDLLNYNEGLVDNRVTFDELSELFNELSKSAFWIPKFPGESRQNYGFLISVLLLLWVTVFLFLGGTHSVIGGFAFLAAGGALILGLISAKLASMLINGTLEESYLHEREKDFMKISDRWNDKFKSRGLHIDVSRYGAFLTLELKQPADKLGKFLMQASKLKALAKIKVAAPKLQSFDVVKDDQLF